MKLKNEKIVLLADDSEFFRIKFSDILTHAGYRVEIAKDGTEVIEELTSHAPEIDLLILDLQMPHINGFGVLKWIRENNLEGSLPVLVITGAYEPTEILARLKNLGATGLATKASTTEQLLFRVNSLIFGAKEFPRIAKRVPTTVPVDFSCSGTISTGFMLNISETGAFIYYTKESPRAGDTTTLRFSLPDKDRVIETNAKVVWVNEMKNATDNLFKGFGIHFINITPEDRRLIANFVKNELEILG